MNAEETLSLMGGSIPERPEVSFRSVIRMFEFKLEYTFTRCKKIFKRAWYFSLVYLYI